MYISIRRAVAMALFGNLLSATSIAQQSPATATTKPHDHETLEEVVVTANPLNRASTDLSQSATVLQGAALRQQLANSLGETLARTPGLANASFGENVGRPVIRGLQGTRVGILNNSLAVSDASSVSQDHAVSIEPFLADQIEVLRGPSTLLFGSGAIGGVVNMVTPTIPQEIPEEGYSGRVIAQGNTAAEEEFVAGRLDLGQGAFALHLDGFHRRTDDYDIPGAAQLYPEKDHDEEHEGGEEGESERGTLSNSFLKNEGATGGFSWIGEQWRTGVAYTEYRSDYGIPVGAHEDAHGEEHDDEEHVGEEPEEHAEENVTIRLRSERTEAELVGRNPLPGFELLTLRFVDTNYTHTEFEGPEMGTVFKSESDNARLELKHDPWGVWQGVFGIQYTNLDFSAEGAEAFVPPSTTETGAVFWVERGDFDALQVDIGMRYEDVQTDVDNTLVEGEGATGPSADADFQPFSTSAGVIWDLNGTFALSGSVSYAERAPGADELFANGPHIATQVFEIGDSSLQEESNVHVEVGGRMAVDRLSGSATIFTDQFNDFIYQSNTGLEEDGLPVMLWQQQDAQFVGAEAELRYDFEPNRSGHWQLFTFGDIVEGELDDNNDAPLQPPRRVALGVDWDLDNFAANVVWIHAYAQNRLAEMETRTPGYDLLNAEVVYSVPGFDKLDWQIYLKGQNLLDEDIRNSTSYLKDQAPQIGLNVIFGVRAYF